MRARQCWLLAAWAWCWCAAQAGPLLLCPEDSRCDRKGRGGDENIYFVDGQKQSIKFDNGKYFKITCVGNVTLDHPALPRFDTLVRLNHVVVESCPPPQQSYASALRAMNILPVVRLEIYDVGDALSREHLAGLEDIEALALVNLNLTADALETAPKLQYLRLTSVNAPDVERLPATLNQLLLMNTGVTRLDRVALSRFTELASLVVRDDHVTVSVEAVAPLRDLALQAKAVFLDPSLPDTLVKVSLFEWGESAPVPWSACKNLQSLKVVGARAQSLPDGWVARCGALRELWLQGARALQTLAPGALQNATALENVTLQGALSALAPRALLGAAALRRLDLSHNALRAVPPELLYDARRLAALSLAHNRLASLPVGIFAKTKELTELELSHNVLTGDVWGVLGGAESLRELHLSHNPALGDACDAGLNAVHGTSALKDLKFLTKLYLRDTGAHHICADWPRNMAKLTKLDLRDNHIDYVTYADLQFGGVTSVLLGGNNVTALRYARSDFESLTADAARCAGPPRVRLELSAALRCDCRLAWAARALRACPRHLALAPAPRAARCGPGALAGAELGAAPLDQLACELEPRACAPRCRCTRRPRADAPGELWRADCAGAGLAAPPRLPRAPPAALWELRLAHNRIAEPRREDLPPAADLQELDLRNNSIVRVEVAAALLGTARRLRLAHNRLHCACADAPALARLRAADLGPDAPACGPAAPLREPPDCGARGPGAALAAAGVPLLLAAALLGGCLARPAWRARLKAALRGLGWLPRAAEPPDERPYDVFLSFSHHDEEVVRALLARLEGGARPYRVCVHYRDWAPGGWIPAQIAASVRRSRRTLAVVSAHFLRSAWARAEFREAYGAALRDAAPRLLVVLLDEPARLPLDAELRRYLAANTYVRWGDPWFWPKLRAALPPPRGPAPARAAGAGPGAGAEAGDSGASGASAEPLMLQLCPRSLAAEAEAGASAAA